MEDERQEVRIPALDDTGPHRHDGPMPVARTLVRTTYLELAADAPLLRPARARPDYDLRHAVAVTPDFARFLYRGVGYPWNWTRRVGWSYAKWERYLADDAVEIWIACCGGTVAGYFELVAHAKADDGLDAAAEDGVEIRQFGMFPSFTGRGLGGHVLCDAVERGRSIGNGRVWLHTCTADHPHALANYLARGMRPFKEEEGYEDVETGAEPWPGAFAPAARR